MNFKKILSLLLVVCMVVAMAAACESKPSTTTSSAATSSENAGETSEAGTTSEPADDWDAEIEFEDELAELDPEDPDAAIYKAALYDFYVLYQKALAVNNVSKRYALMAQAEAKLLESGVMIPLSTQGGNYAISRVAPYTASPVLWGNDSDRYHNCLIATDFITAADRQEMKDKWGELKGTGTYEKWAKDYLTGKGYTLMDSYSLGYPSDPETWDALATSRAADSEAIVNCYDGLVEYDCENELQPAMAESWEVSEDGKTYTFHIRKGQIWVDSQGRKVADFKADDFVAGMQHMMDAEGGLEYLVAGIIVGVEEYLYEDGSFEDVGISAPDDETLVIELVYNCPFFMTMLSYNCFAPMSRQYYTSQGGKFGAEFDASADGYNYGKSPETIAYCGPYTVTNATEKNTIVFKANENYWNKDNINIKTITWKFNDGEIATKAYEDALAGEIAGCGLSAASLTLAKEKDGGEFFKKYSYTSSTDATSFMGFFNVNRQQYANVNDENTCVSSKTDAQKEETRAAMLNVHFRRALTLCLDRANYNAQTQGDELKLTSLRNSYTPGNFVSLPEEVSVSLNGEKKTYAAGTWYGQIMQDQLDADQFPVKVWDAKTLSGDGFDGWYNPTEAAKELELAIADLAKDGVEVSETNPITIDVPVFTGSEIYNNRGNVLKQSIESALGGKVIVNLTDCPKALDWYYAGYYTESGAEANYEIYDVSGWGPDYGDPQTYLDTFLPFGAGYMVKSIGLY